MNVKEIEKDEAEFEEMLNDNYGTATICGMEYGQGTALKELDPTAFRVAMADDPIQYQCGECDQIFEDEEEAEECCKEEEEEEDGS